MILILVDVQGHFEDTRARNGMGCCGVADYSACESDCPTWWGRIIPSYVGTGTHCYMYCQHYGHERSFMLVRRYTLNGSNAYKDVYQLQVERAPMSCSSQRCLMRLPRPTCESVFAFQTYVENDPSHEYSKFFVCSQNDSLSCGCLDDKGSAQHGRMTGHECV